MTEQNGDLCPHCKTPNPRDDGASHRVGEQPFHQERACDGCGRALMRDVPGGAWHLRFPEQPSAAH
jgi:hypothetical protein